MKRVLTWLKANPITVASILVVVCSLGFLIWVHLKGRELQREMAAREQVLSSLQSYTRRNVEVPARNPDEPPRQYSGITINDPTIELIRRTFERMGGEYRQIVDLATRINQGGHQPLLPNVFPSTGDDPALPYEARRAYLMSFVRMLEGGSEHLPDLNAGLPPTPEELSMTVARVESEFRNAPGVAATQLTPDEQADLERQKSQRLLDVLQVRAQQIHLYADPSLNSPAFPFSVLGWAFTEQSPEDWQLWEGQLELWIQQDIAEAIARTNRTDDPNSSVLTAPIKRLHSVYVHPGYVGLHTLGALEAGTQQQQQRRQQGSRARAQPTAIYPPPIPGQTGDPNSRVADNFYVGPTGRVSNALYDVRHVSVDLVADYARLPEFFENLSRVNFMTVLKVTFQDVDEYEALREGFVYGSGDDVVRVNMVIETLWLRAWTTPLMPKLTRQYLGLDEPRDLQPTGDGAPGGFGGPFGSPFGAGDEGMY